MNLNDFESHIDGTILSRGLSYFNTGKIVSLEFDDGEWVADIDGSGESTPATHSSK